MKFLQEVTRRQVSEYFLRLEADKGDPIATSLAFGCFSDDSDFFQQYRAYADECKTKKRESPVLIWSVGVPGDNRFLDVKQWVLTEVDVSELYSCAMGKNTKIELDAVRGNIKAFAASVKNNPIRYPEFNLSRFPHDVEKQIVIGVVHSTNGRQGSIELIDAAHRTVSMIANDINTVLAYTAILKQQ